MVRKIRSPTRPRRQTASPPEVPRVPVVGVGASAGGVKALQTFFEAMPAAMGAAFVVIVHLDPDAHSEMAEILGARCKLPVRQVTASTPLNPDCIYVIPPDRELHITDDSISVHAFTEPRGRRAPIDRFFRSLAEQRGDGFAVILTGAGADGAIGVQAVKESGGIILVQDPEEAEYPSMPRAAIATGAADIIAPTVELARRLVELVQAKAVAAPARNVAEEEDGLRRILAHLRVRTGHDFSHYKMTTITRRVQRRMQVTRKESFADYFAYLRETAEEAQALLADLLISVTTFFRDAKAFEALAQQVIPTLFEENRLAEGIRAWAAGCATGEEAYSLAILVLEEAARHDFRPDIQVFGSDMDLRALSTAREGRYPASIEADVSEERLRRFFTREGDHYRVKRELRDVVLFAQHSVLKDPPFSRVGLISCRNVLIYLNRELQHQVLATLHYGLNADGYLFLGSSETAEHADGLFATVDRDARIYRSTGRSADRLVALPRLQSVSAAERAHSVAATSPGGARNTLSGHREALEALAPPSIMVDEANHVIHLSETAGRFLQPSGGPLTSDITDLVRQELRFELRGALNRAFEREETVLSEAIPVRFNGSAVRVYLQVRPIRGEGRDGQRALVMFIEGGRVAATSADGQGEPGAASEAVERLKQELEVAQLRQRTTHEESEAANEELRAANEELQSINEEYRSTAEELETSKEELQSINEELQTVNSELKLKLETVSRANSDLQNLMAAMDFGILFLDPELRIKRFTPRLADLFSITASDVGRSITDFAHQLDYDDLAKDAVEVLEHLAAVEREIRSRAGGWYLVRLRPYRTVDDKIDGVVASFVDITERRRMESALRESEDRLRQEMRLVELSRAPIFVWDFDDGVLRWNRGSEELYGYSREEALGRDKAAMLRTTVPGASFEAVRAALVEKGTWQGELNQVAKDGRRLVTAARIEMISVGDRRYVLESTRDITESKTLTERQRLLLNELTHRVKNTLTVVQSMVHQTSRASGTREAFVERIDGRIAALANAHRLLVESDWEGADLYSLVKSQLGYVDDDSNRLRLSGPPARLPPHIATPMGLVLHELGTNASKHGALSTPTGWIELGWRLETGNPEPTLVVSWKETGGPPVTTPSRSGFGARLIRQGIPGSVVEHEYAESGVTCVLRVPLATREDDGTAV